MTPVWVTRRSRIVYENPWISVREDDVTRPDGTEGIYGVVRLRRPAVFIVAMTEADEVVLVQVPRYTTGIESWEVPAGGSDGEDPLVAAQRELREESGFAAAEWTYLGSMNALNGIADAQEIVYLARGLTQVGGDEQADEGILSMELIPWADVMAMLRRGEIVDGETVACLMLAALHLGRVS